MTKVSENLVSHGSGNDFRRGGDIRRAYCAAKNRPQMLLESTVSLCHRLQSPILFFPLFLQSPSLCLTLGDIFTNILQKLIFLIFSKVQLPPNECG